MKTNKMLIMVMLLSLTIFIPSCKKGDTGTPGKDGTNGINGMDGTNGNANVISTNTVTLSGSSSWTLNGSLYYATLNAAGITQSIVDNGAIIVFHQIGSGWNSMPYTLGTINYSIGFGVGFVNIYTSSTDGSTPSNPGSQTFRVEIIEGN